MDRSRSFSFLIAILAMAGVFTVACDSGTQEPDAPSLVPTEVPENPVAAIPDEFPEDKLPVYPGSVPAQGRGGMAEGVALAAIQLHTADSPEEVYDFYVDKLARDGWTIQDYKTFPSKNSISATNGECSATVVAASEEGVTNIFLFTEC